MKKIKIVFIFLIILLVLSLSYLCYRLFLEISYKDSFNQNVSTISTSNNKLQNNEKTNINKTKQINIDDSKIKKIQNKIKNYTALGDSITLGTGLENIDTEAYPSLLTNTFNIESTNYGIDGMNSSWLLYNIKHGDYVDSIKDADLITISVGSNDILWIFYQIIADAFNVDINNCDNLIQSISENFAEANITEKIEMIKKLYENTYSDKTKKDLKDAIENYKKTWPELVKTIKNINPKGELIVIEYYNPYHNIVLPFFNTNSISFNKYLDSYVDELNNFLYENNNLGYDIAYIKDDFYKSDSTNVHISPFNFSLDPHPNKNGHYIIYEKIINLLNEKSK